MCTSKRQTVRTIAVDIQPALQMDGGAIEVVDVDGPVVRVRFHGTCSGCPSTIMAVVMGIEQELRRHVPEVEYLVAADF